MSTQVIKHKSELIKWGVTAALTLAVFLIPIQGFYTEQVRLFFAITVASLCIIAFEFFPVIVMAIVMPSLWGITGVAPISVIMSPWVGSTMLMIVGAFFMAASLEACGILKRIAFVLLCKIKGSYFGLLASIYMVGVILNIFTSGRAYLIMAPLCAGLCITLNGMQRKLGAAVCAAVFLGSCSSHAFTFQASGWGLLLGLAADILPPGAITPLSVMLHNWPLFFVVLLTLFIVAKWYKPEEPLGSVTYFQEELDTMGKISREEKVNLGMMILLLVYIFTISLHKLDLNLGYALIPWIVYLPFVQGANTETLKKVNWQMIFFVSACMSIGTVASSMGLGDVIGAVCIQFLGDSNSPFLLMSIVFAIVFLLNFLMTPMAILALIIQPVLIAASSLGYNPVPFAYAVNACVEAILLPYEYVPYLVVYSFGMITMADFIKINILRSLIFFSGYLLVLVPYWMLIGLL